MDPHDQSTNGRITKADMIVRLFTALLFFGFLGPPLGLVGLFTGLLFFDSSNANVDLAHVVPLVALSYVFGVLPALVTGLTAWTFRNKLGRYWGGLACGFMGALSSAMFWLVLPKSPLPWSSV